MSSLTILLVGCGISGLPKKYEIIYYPLGLMSLAAYLRDHGYSNIEIVDLIKPGEVDRIISRVQKNPPDIIGLSALSNEADNLHLLTTYFRYHCPEALIVAGGAYPSASREKVLEDLDLDLAVVGEGEGTFLDIIHRYSENKSLTHIPGTVFRDDEGRFVSAIPRPSLDIELLPDPAWDLVEIDFYSYRSSTPVGDRRYMGLFTSRACPYQCTYCHDVFGKTYRELSAARIVSQIDYLMTHYDIHDFEFVDDIWNINRHRLVEFCNLVIEKKLDIRFHFPNGVRTDLLTEAQLTLLKQAGLGLICFAVETADPTLQVIMKKRVKLDKVKEVMSIAHRLEIYTVGFFMMGFPNETVWQMLKTVWFIVTSPLTGIQVSTVTPYPGTALYKSLTENGTNIDDFSYSNSDFMYRKNLSGIPQFLFELIKAVALVLFYLNPIRILKVVKVFKDFNIEWRFYSRFKHILSFYFVQQRADEMDELSDFQRFNVPSRPKKNLL